MPEKAPPSQAKGYAALHALPAGGLRHSAPREVFSATYTPPPKMDFTFFSAEAANSARLLYNLRSALRHSGADLSICLFPR